MTDIAALLDDDNKEKRKTALAAANTDDLRKELNKREMSENIFPLEIFHPAVKPLIEAMVQHYDLDRGYIGLGMFSAYSTAIGTSFCVSTNGQDKVYLSVWGCLLGLSSSGKSLTLNKCYEPLFDIQNEFDRDWTERTEGKSEGEIRDSHMPTALFMDAHIPTLIRWILPDNPKGVAKIADELLEWINGMNPSAKGGKDGTDEQFWIRTWNCAPAYVTRSGKQKTVLRRPFVNILGGTQYGILHNFFAKNRDVTGFIFRLLFAIDDRQKIAEIDPDYSMPREFTEQHHKLIKLLYEKFDVQSTDDAPNTCVLGKEAVQVYRLWVNANIKRINAMENVNDKDIQSGIFGKIKEYALRFAAILYITDKAFDALAKTDTPDYFTIGLAGETLVPKQYMERALLACNYFYKTATIAYQRVQKQMYAPAEAITVATLFTKANMSYGKMGEKLYGDATSDKDRQRKAKRAERVTKKYIAEYPWLFNAKMR